MQVQLKVDEEGTVRNLADAFTDRYTLISELTQNARRAGATAVQIHYEEADELLTVGDDGCGIQDFQALMHINRSGWGEALESEHPFGAGFMKCLSAATRCVFTSGGRMLAFDTEAALRREMLDVVEADWHPGTVVALYGVKFPNAPRFEQVVASMFKGYPIPVFLNGTDMARPHAPCNLDLRDTPIGKVAPTDVEAKSHSRAIVAYLQGFKVMGPLYNEDAPTVVHLDSNQFIGRYPDRTHLKDQGEQQARVEREVRALYVDRLQALRRVYTSEQFADRCYDAATLWRALDLFNDVDVLPRQVSAVVGHLPIQSEDRPYVDLAQALTRAELERGAVKVVVLDEVTADNALYWMLAWKKQYVVLTNWLGPDHWIERYVSELEHKPAGVRVNKPGRAGRFYGRYLSTAVVLCESVVVDCDGEEAMFTDNAIYDPITDTVYVPAGETSGDVCEQLSNYFDADDHYDNDARDEDVGRFAQFIALLRADSPSHALQLLVAELELERYPELAGKTFQLRVTPALEVQEIESR